ncbi:MAG TPA: hypothetical protein VK074_08300, partial [Fodinibius sp.]|nr:hypothetical protein [Fodinibius sp.]
KAQVVARIEKLLTEHEGLSALAGSAGKEVGSAEGVAMNATNLSGAGREPAVIGAVFGLEQGELSEPVEGISAAFVVQLDNLREADLSNLAQSQRSEIRQQLRKQKGAAFLNTWMEELKKEADIEDNRFRVLQG